MGPYSPQMIQTIRIEFGLVLILRGCIALKMANRFKRSIKQTLLYFLIMFVA